MAAALFVCAAAIAAAEEGAVAERRSLASAGCNNCCFQNDCRLAFAQSSPGVCCGVHRVRGQTGCCPMGATCVQCQNIWKCARSTYISRSARCSICSDDKPPECFYRPTYHHHQSSFLPSLLLLLALCAIAGCLFYGRGYAEPDVVVVQQGYPGQYGPGGVTVVHNDGYGYGGGAVAGAAATGFVGGMLVGEALDGGYGGGYGGGYDGGYGGGGGDMGFGADQ